MQKDADNTIEMGKAFLRTDMFDEAFGCFEKALGHEERTHEALFYLGVTSYKKRNYQDAVDYFKKLLEIRTDSIHIYNNLALSLEKCNRLKEAKLVYNTGLEMSPTSSLLLANRGVLKYKNEEYEGAVRDLTKALKKRPGILFLHFYLALSLIKTDRYAEAKERLEEALAMAPDDAIMLNNLGYLWLKLVFLNQARRYLVKAIRQSSGSSASYVNLAWLYTERGKLEMSLLMLRKAYPDDVIKIRAHLSKLSALLLRSGRGEEARYLAQRANDISNGDRETEKG